MGKTSLALDITRHVAVELHKPVGVFSLEMRADELGLKQLLRDFVVQEYFSLHLLDDPGDVDVPVHTPESCDLRVFFQYGRWFVTWLKLDSRRGPTGCCSSSRRTRTAASSSPKSESR
jgi:DnaB-like helicase C terminal domain